MQFEFKILDYLQTIHNPVLDSTMIGVSALGDKGMIYIAFCLLLLLYPKTRRIGGYLSICLAIELFVCNGIIKPIVARPRPYTINPNVVLLTKAFKDYSFPSGHTTPAFAMAAGAFRLKRKDIGIVFLILGMIMAFSRMYLYMHFPTDILGAMILGSILGWVVCELVMRIEERTKKKPAV
ncbi:MAG: phosphatase PAP2 family protein [Eubacteriales bacterium]|nr:phosphatase PAP2 family protein [Eubacteriales bacterium]